MGGWAGFDAPAADKATFEWPVSNCVFRAKNFALNRAAGAGEIVGGRAVLAALAVRSFNRGSLNR